jgi:hypothetical protein
MSAMDDLRQMLADHWDRASDPMAPDCNDPKINRAVKATLETLDSGDMGYRIVEIEVQAEDWPKCGAFVSGNYNAGHIPVCDLAAGHRGSHQHVFRFATP